MEGKDSTTKRVRADSARARDLTSYNVEREGNTVAVFFVYDQMGPGPTRRRPLDSLECTNTTASFAFPCNLLVPPPPKILERFRIVSTPLFI